MRICYTGIKQYSPAQQHLTRRQHARWWSPIKWACNPNFAACRFQALASRENGSGSLKRLCTALATARLTRKTSLRLGCRYKREVFPGFSNSGAEVCSQRTLASGACEAIQIIALTLTHGVAHLLCAQACQDLSNDMFCTSPSMLQHEAHDRHNDHHHCRHRHRHRVAAAPALARATTMTPAVTMAMVNH